MDKALLEKYISEGLSSYQIAKKMGKSQTNTRYWMKKHGLKTKPPEKTHLCKHCGETDPAMFYVDKNGKKSKSNCKTCHNSNRNAYNKNKRKRILESRGGKCEICGYDMKTGSVQALVFHHIDPQKKDPNWKTSRGWSEERLIKEVKGCMLLCANCHAEEHDADFFRT